MLHLGGLALLVLHCIFKNFENASVIIVFGIDQALLEGS